MVREKLLQAAVDMYHTLALTLAAEEVEEVKKEEYMEEVKKETKEGKDLAADDDLIADTEAEPPKVKVEPGLRIAKFARK